MKTDSNDKGKETERRVEYLSGELSNSGLGLGAGCLYLIIVVCVVAALLALLKSCVG